MTHKRKKRSLVALFLYLLEIFLLQRSPSLCVMLFQHGQTRGLRQEEDFYQSKKKTNQNNSFLPTVKTDGCEACVLT